MPVAPIKQIDGAIWWIQLTAALLQDGCPLRVVRVMGEFLDFLPLCAICGKVPFCPLRCAACCRITCQPCVEQRSKFDEASHQWVVPCCGGKTHVYDYKFSAAWLTQLPRWPQPSTYRLNFKGRDIKTCSFAHAQTRTPWGSPSVSYVDLHDAGKCFITIMRFSEAHLKEVGATVFDAGFWQRDGHNLRLTLHRMPAAHDSGVRTRCASLPSEFILHEASLLSGSVLMSISARNADSAWAPCADLRLLPTGNASARHVLVVVRCLRWLHGTSNMLVCLCADEKVVTVKEHEVEVADGRVATSWTMSQRHGQWFELGALLLVTFNHRGCERSVSSHALFFDTAPGTYKGLMTWRDGKVCVHAGEVEAKLADLPKVPCFTKSASWTELPLSVSSVSEVEMPALSQCENDFRCMSPANATLICNDYVRFLMTLMVTDGLDNAAYVQQAKQFMKVIDLTSHFCTAVAPPSREDISESCRTRHEERLLVTAFSLAGEQICSRYVENVVGASSAVARLMEILQPWEDESLHIELISEHKEANVISEYSFQAVRLDYQGLDVDAARARLSGWGLGCRHLPSQLGMALQGASASAQYQLCRDYFTQLRQDLDEVASAPLCGSHYIVLLDVSSSMQAHFLRAYPEEVAEFEAVGLDSDTLLNGTNLLIVEHILDAFLVPQLLDSGVRVGNAKFSHQLVRVEPPSNAPTPFMSDQNRDGGGTEIYGSLMAAAAHLTLPVLNMTGDAGVILITDGEQTTTKMDVNSLARIFNRNFRLEVIGIRAQLTGPLQRLIRGSFSVPYQIGSLKNLMTALSETIGRIQRRAATAPENRNDIRQPVELYHSHMWYLLSED